MFIENSLEKLRVAMSSEFEPFAEHLSKHLDLEVEKVIEACNTYKVNVPQSKGKTEKEKMLCSFIKPKGDACTTVGKEQHENKWYCGTHFKKVSAVEPCEDKPVAKAPPKKEAVKPLQAKSKVVTATVPEPKPKTPLAKSNVKNTPIKSEDGEESEPIAKPVAKKAVKAAPVEEEEDVEVPVDSDEESTPAPVAKKPATTKTVAVTKTSTASKPPAAKGTVLDTVRAKTTIQNRLNIGKVGEFHIEPLHRIAFDRTTQEVIGVLHQDKKTLLPLTNEHVKFIESHGLVISDNVPKAKQKTPIVVEAEESEEVEADGDDIEEEDVEDEEDE